MPFVPETISWRGGGWNEDSPSAGSKPFPARSTKNVSRRHQDTETPKKETPKKEMGTGLVDCAGHPHQESWPWPDKGFRNIVLADPTIDLCIVKARLKGIPPGSRASPSVIGRARVNRTILNRRQQRERRIDLGTIVVRIARHPRAIDYCLCQPLPLCCRPFQVG